MVETRPSAPPLQLKLPRRALRRLQEAGIYCRTGVRLEYQQLARRYILSGTESGGATAELGRYVTFAGPEGEPLEQLHPVDSLGANGIHALVIAPVLVKVDIFRFGRTYQLLISKHQPSEVSDGKRPNLMSTGIFQGIDGYLGLELCGKDRDKAGLATPEFYSRSGEKVEIPAQFRAVVQAATLAASCQKCVHSHYLMRYPAATIEP